MIEISIFLAIHTAAIFLWLIDSRSFLYLRSRNKYMRQFRKHEKAHRRHMAEMDMELIEMTIQSMEQQLREQHKDAHNPSIISLSESLEMINQKDKYKKKRIKPAREDSFWPSWDDYRNLDK
jgi:hypothetical protein